MQKEIKLVQTSGLDKRKRLRNVKLVNELIKSTYTRETREGLEGSDKIKTVYIKLGSNKSFTNSQPNVAT